MQNRSGLSPLDSMVMALPFLLDMAVFTLLPCPEVCLHNFWQE